MFKTANEFFFEFLAENLKFVGSSAEIMKLLFFLAINGSFKVIRNSGTFHNSVNRSSRPEKYFEGAGTRTRGLSIDNAYASALTNCATYPLPERAHALYIARRTYSARCLQ